MNPQYMVKRKFVSKDNFLLLNSKNMVLNARRTITSANGTVRSCKGILNTENMVIALFSVYEF
jgi:hypothetical protein